MGFYTRIETDFTSVYWEILEVSWLTGRGWHPELSAPGDTDPNEATD